MKIVWNLCKEPYCLWASTIRAKYVCGKEGFPKIEQKKVGMNLSRGLLWELGWISWMSFFGRRAMVKMCFFRDTVGSKTIVPLSLKRAINWWFIFKSKQSMIGLMKMPSETWIYLATISQRAPLERSKPFLPPTVFEEDDNTHYQQSTIEGSYCKKNDRRKFVGSPYAQCVVMLKNPFFIALGFAKE